MDAPEPGVVDELFDRFLELELEGEEDALERVLAEVPDEATRAALLRLVELDRQVLSAVPDVLDVNQRLGSYRLIEEIARGGQGIVYRAEQPSLSRDVAIKVLPPDRSQSRGHRKKLAQESVLLGGLQHPAIVSAIELLTTDRGLCLVMAYLPHPSLQRVLELASREGVAPQEVLRRHCNEAGSAARDPVQLCCKLVETAARGLDAAHRAGVLHGDVKPSNLLVGKDGHPYLIDFGLAQLQGPREEQGFSVHGTLPYVAPEVLQSGQGALSPAADVYGLAATLYELLCGEPIFRAESFLELLRRARDEAVPPLRTRARRLPPELDLILRRALARDPAQRTASALAFAEELARFREGRALDTRGEPLLRRAWLAWRVARQRHRTWIGAGAAAALLLAATLLLWPQSNFGRVLAALEEQREEGLETLLRATLDDGSFAASAVAPHRELLRSWLRARVEKGEVRAARTYCDALLRLDAGDPSVRRIDARLGGRTVVVPPTGHERLRVLRSNVTGEFLTPTKTPEVLAGPAFLLEPGYWRVVFEQTPGAPRPASYLIRCDAAPIAEERTLAAPWPYEDEEVEWVEFRNVETPLGQSRYRGRSLNREGGPRISITGPYSLQKLEFSFGRFERFCAALKLHIARGERPPFIHPDDKDYAALLKLRDRRRVADPAKPLGFLNFYDAFAVATWAYARLPTEHEWEGAARAGCPEDAPYGFPRPVAEQGRSLVVGFDAELAYTADSTEDYRNVDVDPLPPTPHGLLHLYDNVGEITSTLFSSHEQSASIAEASAGLLVLKGYLLKDNPDRPDPDHGLVPAWARDPLSIVRAESRRSHCGLRLAYGMAP